MQDEIAPPFENWEAHLRALDNRDLIELAEDYRWLDEEARAEEEGPEFRARRDAVIAECERRGLSEVAASLRRPVMRGGSDT
jgi:hypothetical protein